MKTLRLQILASATGALLMGLMLVGDPTPASSQEEDAPGAETLWQQIQEASYREWAPYAGAPDGYTAGTRPHGALLRTFGNEAASTDAERLPAGAIIVKENYTPDTTLAAITVMKKVEGYDAENRNWFWVKYTPEGEVAEENGARLAGKVRSCIGCHATAGGGDYIYTNDRNVNESGANDEGTSGDAER